VETVPDGAPPQADGGEVGTLAAIAGKRRTLGAIERARRTPERLVAAAGADELRVAVDAAFGDVDRPAARHPARLGAAGGVRRCQQRDDAACGGDPEGRTEAADEPDERGAACRRRGSRYREAGMRWRS
jgi:hypothetical protein